MVWTAATAGPVPGVRTSGPSLVGAAPPGTVSVGFSPNAPATLTPELTEEADGDAAEDDGEPAHAARGGGGARRGAATGGEGGGRDEQAGGEYQGAAPGGAVGQLHEEPSTAGRKGPHHGTRRTWAVPVCTPLAPAGGRDAAPSAG